MAMLRRRVRKERPDATSMSLVEHLTELRDRLFHALFFIAIGAVICFALFGPILGVMVGPYKAATGKALIFTHPLEAFVTRLKVAAYGGFVFASPVIFWHIWRFITPGLTPNEKRYAVPFVASSVALFMTGTVFAMITFPRALSFLLSMGGEELDPFITAGSYLSMVVLMMIAFGVAFELPIVVVFLLLARVVTTRTLRQYRRHTFLGIVVLAAVITPSQDPITLFAMAGPMYLLFEAAILIGRFLKR